MRSCCRRLTNSCSATVTTSLDFLSADPTRLLDQPGIHIHPCHVGVVSSAFVSYTVLVQLQKVLGGDLLLPPRVDAAQGCLLSSRVLRFSAPCPSGN